jgi:hypothetical protein
MRIIELSVLFTDKSGLVAPAAKDETLGPTAAEAAVLVLIALTSLLIVLVEPKFTMKK